MPRFVPLIAPHLDDAALMQRTQDCQDPIEKQRWLVIQLLSQPDAPMTTQQVATALHYFADWVRKQVQRYNRLGADGSGGWSAAPPATRQEPLASARSSVALPSLRDDRSL